jgi:signal peptidase I
VPKNKKDFSNRSQSKALVYTVNAAFFVVPLIIVLVLRTFFIGNFYIPSGSMENTLLVSDRVLTIKDPEPKRGDIVVFKDDQHWLSSDGNQYLVKRVAAVGGETIEGKDGKIFVNGKAINEVKYLKGKNVGLNSTFEIQKVPNGKLFVLGDNRENSADSRFHIASNTQFINESSVTGKPFFIYWPFNRLGGVS